MKRVVGFCLRTMFLSLALAACDDAADGDDDDADGGAAGDMADAGPGDEQLFDPTSLLEIEIGVSEQDWATVRNDGRSLSEVLRGCDDPAFAYTRVPASLRVGDQELEQVVVRKKGYLGSISTVRPSLRVLVDGYDPRARVYGVKDLTLNNSRQDPSYTHQCMAYAVFERAGLPSPRCSFTRVHVNGEDLGVYVNVEPIKKPFLRRHFGDDSGNLYEGSGGADFRHDMLDAFEKKTNESDPSRDELEALSEALLKPDGELEDAVAALVDLDAFLRFWAVESLISHWDGYTGDLNNFFVYHDPSTGKLGFIPWGTDGAFDKDHAFLPEIGRPKSVLAWARLPMRLYDLPETRERYRQVLREVLDEVWDEDALLAEVDRIGELTGADPEALEAQRDFILTRRAEMLDELDGNAPSWTFPERNPGTCEDDTPIEISGTFNAVYGDISNNVPRSGLALDVPLDGEPMTFATLLSSAGPSEENPASPAVRLVGLREDGSFLVVQIELGARELVPGEIPFHGFESVGFVVEGNDPSRIQVLGLVSDGVIVLEEAGTTAGAIVRGHFTGKMTRLAVQL